MHLAAVGRAGTWQNARSMNVTMQSTAQDPPYDICVTCASKQVAISILECVSSGKQLDRQKKAWHIRALVTNRCRCLSHPLLLQCSAACRCAVPLLLSLLLASAASRSSTSRCCTASQATTEPARDSRRRVGGTWL